jgi:myo-inositol-1(or 4)-monophosphatase
VCNPATGETIVGGRGLGVRLDGRRVGVRATCRLEGAEVLASRSEIRRGEWRRYRDAPFRFRPMGSVAWKLALVAAGRADATWTLCPKHEWDVAAGVALVRAGGGDVRLPDGGIPTFNRVHTLLPGLVAGPVSLLSEVVEQWARIEHS